MESNAYYRARNSAIADHIRNYGEQGKRWLQNGFISDDMKADFDVFINDRMYPQSNEPLSLTELCTYSTWFEMHPEKVAGVLKGSTSMMIPVFVEGGRADIDKMFGKVFNSEDVDEVELLELEAEAIEMRLRLINN